MPDGCPQRFYDLMTKCWDKNPSNRPTAESITEKLQTEQNSPPKKKDRMYQDLNFFNDF